MKFSPLAGSVRPLFVATVLVGSFLLFLVQPMVARMALPRLGGAPNVWNSAMLVYQALLLAGYAYAHRLSRQPFRRQAPIHLVLMVLAGISLPVALFNLPSSAAGWEVLWVPLLLALTIGPVFFLVSAQAPLMQKWFAAHPHAGEPWALYAASNLGSFAGLIAYPLLAEPLLRIDSQSWVWSLGYGLLIGLVALSAWSRWRVADRVEEAPAQRMADAPPVGTRRILLWLALSAVPSGLMLSTTTHLTTDIFAMPLLWVIPLGIYLLSFVVSFADRRELTWAVTVFAPITILLAGGLAMVSDNAGTVSLAAASVLLLFVIAVSLHGRLYESRPEPAQLTLFYLTMSVGGALGGAFTAIVAPVLFDWVWEHPILVFAAALLMPLPELLPWRRLPGLEPDKARLTAGILLALAIFLALLLYGVASETDKELHRIVLTVMLAGIGILLASWRWLFAAVLAMLMLAQGGLDTLEETFEGSRTRSYFGVYTVRDYPQSRLRMLIHGTTLHGQQSLDPAKKDETTTYYGPGSGVGLALDQADVLYGEGARIGVIGLGTGTLACLRKPGQDWTFFEIDPAVLEFSRDGTFTYLSDCAPEAKVVIGDARLELADARPANFDILAVDAFSSDAIPLHLLTTEAIGVYLRALSKDGLLLIHISNRYFDLEPVLSAIAKQRGLAAAVRNDNPSDRHRLTPSSWVVFSRDPQKLKALAHAHPDAAWEGLKPPAPQAWTDDYASILPHIRWQRISGKQ